MHYYQHHIGDFIKDTARLNDSQCMAYLRLIWVYYDTEAPLKNDIDALAFEIGANVSDVHQILNRFFFMHEDGFWHHSRCNKVILEFREKSEKAKKSANARWSNANAMRTHNERNANVPVSDANHNPITNNPVTKEKNPARGTRLPADWTLPDDWKDEAKQIRPEWPDHHVQRVADGFKDYWLAKAGKDAAKANWLATWRNWCRNDKAQIYGVLNGQHQNTLGGNSGKNRPGGSAFDKVVNEINAARQRDGRTPMGHDDAALRPQVDQQLWGDTGPDGGVGGIIEGDFTRND